MMKLLENIKLLRELSEDSFILLDGKSPKHKYSEPKTSDVMLSDEKDIGIMVKGNYVVLDFDDKMSYLKIKELVETENIPCHIMQTSRGGHFWFKSTEPLANNIGINTPLGVSCDVRSYGKNSLVVIKKNGELRKWIRVSKDVGELPYYLKPMKHKYEFTGEQQGSRNGDLFSYIITLTMRGFKKDEIRHTIRLINTYIFDESLPESEIETILRDESFTNLRPAFFSEKGRFLHDVFAEFVAKTHNVCASEGQLLIYNDGYYDANRLEIERAMIHHISNITRNQRNETLEYLKIMAQQLERQRYYNVCVQNGVYNTKENILMEHNPEHNMRNKINAVYDPHAYNESVDHVLDKITCGDKEVRSLLEEMIGYCMLPTTKYQVSFILYGGGSNGKSTLLDMITNMIGDSNVSSLSMSELNHNFKLSQISGKLVNIGDDINGDYIKDNSIFKKLVTGDELTVDVKNETPYKMRNYATLLFATNNLPQFKDKSEGNERRLIIVPFNAKFSKNDPDYDPFIGDKLEEESAKSYLLNLAIMGMQRVYANNGFTKSKQVDKMLLEFQKDNNNVIEYLETAPDLNGLTHHEVYMDYVNWCESNGTQEFKLRKFNKELKNTGKYDSKQTTRKKERVYVWQSV